MMDNFSVARHYFYRFDDAVLRQVGWDTESNVVVMCSGLGHISWDLHLQIAVA